MTIAVTMKKKISVPICFLVIYGLVACSLFPTRSEKHPSQEEIENQYQVVSALLTQTAQAAPVDPAGLQPALTSAPNSPVVSETQPFTGTAIAGETIAPEVTTVSLETLGVGEELLRTPQVSATQSSSPSESAASAAPCDLAQLGFPGDLNVPDGTQLLPEHSFSKTWRLYNAGSCTWTADYAIVWFSGYYMGGSQVQPLNVDVPPGSTIDVTLDLVAPQAPGAYQSNWKIQNKKGEMFGIGPNGDAPFWLRIEVISLGTPTVVPPTAEATPIPIIYASGSMPLMLGEGLDLDSAQVNQAEQDDIRIDSTEAGEMQLASVDSARLTEYGNSIPQMFDCSQTGDYNTPLVLQPDLVGVYYCYRTTQGLPGWVTIKSIDPEKGQVDLEFVTWVVP